MDLFRLAVGITATIVIVVVLVSVTAALGTAATCYFIECGNAP